MKNALLVLFLIYITGMTGAAINSARKVLDLVERLPKVELKVTR